jgi:hypothetical protein
VASGKCTHSGSCQKAAQKEKIPRQENKNFRLYPKWSERAPAQKFLGDYTGSRGVFIEYFGHTLQDEYGEAGKIGK